MSYTPSLSKQAIASNVIQNHCLSFTCLKISPNQVLIPQQNASKQFFVISGSFIVHQNAVKKAALLKRAGYKKASIKIFPESEFYSIVVDSFSTELEALELKQHLSNKKFESFIKRLFP